MAFTQKEVKDKMTGKMKEVIEAYADFKTPPLHEVSPQVARELPTLTDAVLNVMAKHFTKKLAGPVVPVEQVQHKVIAQGGHELVLRIYTPKGEGPFPVMVYYHGGGFVMANLDTYDASCRALTNAAKVITVSVAYRQAPEFKYPIPQDDAFRAYKWVLENAITFNGDRHRVMIAGESAGGNLAATVCLRARETKIPMPIHQLLVYPVTDFTFSCASHEQYKNALPLNEHMMSWFKKHYLEIETQATDPHVSPLHADLHGLPSATIITAELDPLCDEGKAYADKLRAAGVDVSYKCFNGVTHEFFGMGALIPEAKEAVKFAADRIQDCCKHAGDEHIATIPRVPPEELTNMNRPI